MRKGASLALGQLNFYCNAHRLASDDTYAPRACGGDTK